MRCRRVYHSTETTPVWPHIPSRLTSPPCDVSSEYFALSVADSGTFDACQGLGRDTLALRLPVLEGCIG